MLLRRGDWTVLGCESIEMRLLCNGIETQCN